METKIKRGTKEGSGIHVHRKNGEDRKGRKKYTCERAASRQLCLIKSHNKRERSTRFARKGKKGKRKEKRQQYNKNACISK